MKGSIFVVGFRAISIDKQGQVISTRRQDAASGIKSKEKTGGIIGDVNLNTNRQQVSADFSGSSSALGIISSCNEMNHKGLTMPGQESMRTWTPTRLGKEPFRSYRVVSWRWNV